MSSYDVGQFGGVTGVEELWILHPLFFSIAFPATFLALSTTLALPTPDPDQAPGSLPDNVAFRLDRLFRRKATSTHGRQARAGGAASG